MFRRSLPAAAMLAAAAFLMGTVAVQAQSDYTAARLKMVDDLIEAEGISNKRVLDSVRQVPRHLFIRKNLRHLAYTDQALDLGHKQTISPPFIVSYMTEIIDPQPEDRVLEIGTGSGYQAAVLSGLVKDVYTIEIVEPLGRHAESLLKELKYDNVHVRIGDGYLGWPEEAPFDKIIVTCSPESIPKPLIEQLKEGGRMVIPLGERYQQVFYLMEKKDGELRQTKLLPTLFVPMTGKAEASRTVKPDPLHPTLVNGDFERDEDENERADGWHYHRRASVDHEVASSGKCSLRFKNDVPAQASHILQGFAVDGSHVSSLEVKVRHKQHDIHPGPHPGEKPGMIIHFFDAQRRPMSFVSIGPWMTDQDSWAQDVEKVHVPHDAREAIVRVGLNGATGVLWIDEASISRE